MPTIVLLLQTCNRSPNKVSTERSAARTIQLQEEDLQRLRDKVSVLAHAKETDGRRFRQIAVERQREREDLKREVDRLKVFFFPSVQSLHYSMALTSQANSQSYLLGLFLPLVTSYRASLN